MASLLDAHPNVIIANDFNILGQWINNPGISKRKKYYIYELLYAKSRYDVMYGVRSRMVDGKPVQYHYNIKGQWQGKYNNTIQVNGICIKGHHAMRNSVCSYYDTTGELIRKLQSDWLS